jgi:hypothetical protein
MLGYQVRRQMEIIGLYVKKIGAHVMYAGKG